MPLIDVVDYIDLSAVEANALQFFDASVHIGLGLDPHGVFFFIWYQQLGHDRSAVIYSRLRTTVRGRPATRVYLDQENGAQTGHVRGCVPTTNGCPAGSGEGPQPGGQARLRPDPPDQQILLTEL
jgi:hypothetical protein